MVQLEQQHSWYSLQERRAPNYTAAVRTLICGKVLSWLALPVQVQGSEPLRQ